MKKYFVGLILLVLIFTPVLVFAATGLGALSQNLNDAGNAAGTSSSGNLQTIIGTGINAALTLVGLIFMILMVYAGYLWMIARGSEEMVTKAKGIMTAAIIGLVLVVSAYAITVFVTKRFESAGGTGGCCVYTVSGETSCQVFSSKSSCDAASGSFNSGKDCSQVSECQS